MTGTATLAHVRASLGGRLLIAVIAVPAILIGLLAMHVFLTGSMSGGMSTPTGSALSAGTHVDIDPVAHSHSDGGGSKSVDAERHSPIGGGCEGPCGPGHDMLGMLCVLALLVTMVLFTLQVILTGWRPMERGLARLLGAAAAGRPLAPPSLHVLSISRT